MRAFCVGIIAEHVWHMKVCFRLDCVADCVCTMGKDAVPSGWFICCRGCGDNEERWPSFKYMFSSKGTSRTGCQLPCSVRLNPLSQSWYTFPCETHVKGPEIYFPFSSPLRGVFVLQRLHQYMLACPAITSSIPATKQCLCSTLSLLFIFGPPFALLTPRKNSARSLN